MIAGRGRARTALGALAAALVVTLAVGCGDDDDAASTDGGVEIGGSAGIARGDAAWPAPEPDEVAALADAAGAPLQAKETLVHHVHAHLDVFIDGEHRQVPAGIGIIIDDPAVNVGEDLSGNLSYGGIQGCDQPCISPLHTHAVDGVIHTEAPAQTDFTLGQLFEMWAVRLDGRCVGDHCTPDTAVAVYVDGEEVPLHEAPDITLTQGKEIAIVIGDPPDRIPAEADLSGA